MLLLMQQLTTQTHSYSLNGGFLNSTAPPMPTIPEFTPTVNAIRVNVLWFASLTLSLVSASFGILVKQWLREYLAGEYTSPQARLRIRHFRTPGLDHWKVFEIAAILPLLLQLSLALFLIGLCFFTADVHDTIGHTTLPLVAGWGFLFIAASFAPALSPRCPYKTTLLKSAMSTLRKLIFRIIVYAKDISHRTTDTFTQIPTRWSYNILNYDEEEAVITDTNDIDILIAVDSIQSDEQLLTIMWNAIQQIQLDPADSVTFVSKLISHRIQRDIISLPSDTFLDLKRLPKQTITSIMQMVAEILGDEIRRQSPTNISKVIEWSPWMKDCIYILLSETNSPVPNSVNQLFSILLADRLRYTTLFEIIKTRVPDTDTFPHILDRLRGGLTLIKGEDMLSVLAVLMQYYFCNEPIPSHDTLLSFIRYHGPDIESNHLQHLVDLMIFSLTNELKAEMYWFTHLCDELEIILVLSSKASWRDAVLKLIQSILLRQRNTAIFCRFPMALNDFDPVLKKATQDLFIDAVVAANPSERRAIMTNFDLVLNWQWREHPEHEDSSWDRYIRSDPLEACELMFRLLKTLQEKDIQIDEYSNTLSQFWWDADLGLETVLGRHYPGHPDMARRCLTLINELDVSSPPDEQDEDAFAEWAESFPLHITYFPDYTIERIARFLPPEETTFSHRVRRLEIIKKRDENTPERNGSTRSGAASENRRSSKAKSTMSNTSASHERKAISKDLNADAQVTCSDKAEHYEPKENKGDDGRDHDSDKGDHSGGDKVTIFLKGVTDEDNIDDNDILLPSPTNTADPDHDTTYSPSPKSPVSGHG
ncbi:hypothetical protein BDY19DRAFT_407332 [Irpex rosettiformis]|uniref:Uncharacterized protein n=1 Tax=Irpex rosettiformis TaxID=378272 RepID=A0ACB8UFH3_9APHY|nr:hypothetical protein BDY19DRAFT_407332 [Irpex rosettiformis]